MNVIDYAIRMERAAETFFERLGHDTRDNELKGICDILASEERKHVERLDALKGQVDAGDADSTLVERAWHVKNGFEKLLEGGDIIHDLGLDRDGFGHVVKAEEEYIKLLEGMAEAETNKAAGVLLKKIADDEREHLQRMQSVYEFIESPRTYLEWGEFSNLKTL